MHTIWKGNISFGLVNIAVRLHAATQNNDVKLRSLHNECHSPIKYQKYCPVCEKELEHEEIVKGYEYVKNKFVVLSKEELEELKNENEEKNVSILEFVKLTEIDPVYFEKTYYLSPNPEGGGTRAYTLLRQALADTKKIGVAKINIRSNERLAVIRVIDNAIALETLYFPDEVREIGSIPNLPESFETDPKELEISKTLVEHLTATFEPEKYKDEYRESLQELINAKLQGKEVVHAAPAAAPQTNVVDLMEALKASVDQTKPLTQKKKTTKKRKTSTSTRKKA
ncbi:Ku protein [Bacillus tianshenii]|nr:Ku protein [Bacillus tianshenii]